MRLGFLLTIILLALSLNAAPARAQFDGEVQIKPKAQVVSPKQKARPSRLYLNAHRANPQYELMVRTALSDMPEKGFDFTRLRSLYSQTRQYDPIGQDALKLMNDLAYTAINTKDPEKAQLALRGYQQVVATHLGNLGVVMQALSMARSDKRFGKVAFFEWVRDGIIRSVMLGRKGRSLKDSFGVLTLPEETLTIAYLGLRLLKSTPVQEARVFYNMNEVQDPKTGEKWTLFVNTSVPMQFLQIKREENEGVKFDIRKQ